MNPGDLRHIITIQARTKNQDTYGQPVEQWGNTWEGSQTIWDADESEWSLFAKYVHASIEPLSGRELLNALQINTEITTRIRIRYSSVTKDIKPDMRALYNGKILQIISIIDVKERHRELHLMCKEVV